VTKISKYIKETVNTKFLGLQLDNFLNWKEHIDLVIPKLSGAYYTAWSTKFLGLQLDNFLNWKEHITQLGQCSISATLTCSSQFILHIFNLL
jgi:hypothetical protein